jgi:hypothetical protein
MLATWGDQHAYRRAIDRVPPSTAQHPRTHNKSHTHTHTHTHTHSRCETMLPARCNPCICGRTALREQLMAKTQNCQAACHHTFYLLGLMTASATTVASNAAHSHTTRLGADFAPQQARPPTFRQQPTTFRCALELYHGRCVPNPATHDCQTSAVGIDEKNSTQACARCT